MTDAERVQELRRLEREIMEHERAVLELRAQAREILELQGSRREPRRALSRAERQRLLRRAAEEVA